MSKQKGATLAVAGIAPYTGCRNNSSELIQNSSWN